MKSLSLSLRFSFQVSFQKEEEIGKVGVALLLIIIARWAEFVVNQPVLEKVHINLVFGSKDIQILEISRAKVTSNTELRANKFHEPTEKRYWIVGYHLFGEKYN
jgi:hypothetical protein